MSIEKLQDTIDAFAKEGKSWRARPYAEALLKLLEEQMPQPAVCDAYETLATFYVRVRDVRRAYACAQKGAECARALGDMEVEESLLLLGRKCVACLPQRMKEEMGLGEVRDAFLKVDPVEHTDAFHAVFDEVMEATESRLEKEGDLHIPQQRWLIMTEEFALRGIAWRSPARMNPRVMFD